MKCEWTRYRVDEISVNFDRMRIPLSSKEREQRKGCYRYYGAQGIIDHIDDFIFDGEYLLIAEDGENLKSRKQDIAQMVTGKFWVNNHAHILQGNELCLTKYLYYLMKCTDISGYITGSAQPKLSQANMNAIEFNIPPLEMQKKIAAVLSAIDDKIKNNKRINDNLFDQMQALHKSWFVDYEPFDGSKPASWVTTDIYSIANIIYGAPFASKQFNTEGNGTPIIRIRDLKAQEFVTYTTEEHPRGYLLQPADVVVGMDGEFRPYIWGNDEAWLNQRVCVFENKRPNGKAFLYYTIKPLLYAIEQTQVATTVIHIGKKDYDAFEIILPDTETLDRFDALTAPMIQQIVFNNFENKRLAQMRDAILPKLMSGEIDVENVKI